MKASWLARASRYPEGSAKVAGLEGGTMGDTEVYMDVPAQYSVTGEQQVI